MVNEKGQEKDNFTVSDDPLTTVSATAAIFIPIT
jgi:hypothetical protein